MSFNKIEVIKILGISLLSAVLFNSFSSNPIDYIYKPVQSTEKQVVSLEDAKKLADAKEVLFIDAHFTNVVIFPVQSVYLTVQLKKKN